MWQASLSLISYQLKALFSNELYSRQLKRSSDSERKTGCFPKLLSKYWLIIIFLANKLLQSSFTKQGSGKHGSAYLAGQSLEQGDKGE